MNTIKDKESRDIPPSFEMHGGKVSDAMLTRAARELGIDLDGYPLTFVPAKKRDEKKTPRKPR